MFTFFSKIKQTYIKWLRNMTITQILIYTVIFSLFIAIVLPWINDLSFQLIKMKESIDTSFFTEIKDIYLLREEYGETGRYYYVILRITFDVIWPIVYFLFLTSLTAYLSKHKTSQSSFLYINYVPLLAVLLDYLENILAVLFMITYPTRIDLLAFLLIVVSINKWVWIGFSFIQIVVLAIKRGVYYVRK